MSNPLSRRDFLHAAAAAGGGLVVSGLVPAPLRAEPLGGGAAARWPVFLQVTSDDTVTVWLTKSEMGQGVLTALPMIVAEELEADWARVRVRLADFDPKFGSQGTGGSASVRTMYPVLRKAGAQAREMLVAAAAARWGVPAAECRAEAGLVRGPGGRSARFGELAEAAAALEPPESPTLKTAGFRLVGQPLPRLDTPEKTDGTARYGIDVVVPGMRYAVLVRPPVPGARLETVDEAAARAYPGVEQVVRAEGGVAVVGTNTWAAMQGARLLACTWHEGPNARLDSARIERMLVERSRQPGAIGRNDGDAEAALAAAGDRAITAEYAVPYLAHAPMEPMNCTAHVTADRAEIWAPTQTPGRGIDEIAAAAGVRPQQVIQHVTLMGGGFGRRLEFDYVKEAVAVAKAAGVPVKLVWTREQDMQHDWYRPASHHRLSAVPGPNGLPAAWFHCVTAPSITGQRWPERVRGGYDRSALDGAEDLQYGIPDLRVEYAMLNTAVPVGWWRSVYASQNAFANESFVDELAHAAGQDPVAFRLALLRDASPRLHAVVALAAAKSGWGTPLPAGRARGVAAHKSFGTYVAEVVELSLEAGGPRVHRVTCAVDCGRAINPEIVRQQMEGGIVYGLTAALKGEITVEGGRVVQGNFHDYPLLTQGEMPAIETHIVPSDEAPAGVGEPSTPPIAPAVANAIFALTGQRLRRLPLRLGQGA